MENLEPTVSEVGTAENIVPQNSENVVVSSNQNNGNTTPPRRLSFFERYFLIRPEVYIGRSSYFARFIAICLMAIAIIIIYFLLITVKPTPFSSNNEQLAQVQLQASTKVLLESYGIIENNLGKYQNDFEGMPYSYFIKLLSQNKSYILLIEKEIQQNKNDNAQKDEGLIYTIKIMASIYNKYKYLFDEAMKKSEKENYVSTSDIQSISVPGPILGDCSQDSNKVYEAVVVSSKNQRLSCRLISKERNFITTCAEYLKNSDGSFDVIEYYGFPDEGVPKGINAKDKSNRYVILGTKMTGTIPIEGPIYTKTGAIYPVPNLYYLDLLEKKIKSIPHTKVIKIIPDLVSQYVGQYESILYFVDDDTIALGKKELLPSNGEKELSSILWYCNEEGKKINSYDSKTNYKYTVTAEYNLTTGVRTEK